MIQKELVKKRHPNWLPTPRPLKIVPDQIVVSENDLFPKGEVIKFFQGQDYGFIKDQHGRDVYFHLGELDFVGPKNTKNFIKVGARIGYDLSWTSHGQHVRRIKIY
ncbi:MAG: hypothetical protein Q7T03_03480 [Deltaproteobacteria bacterium]|nr:hypothetical protein [Deltaproteobacteria bacterium]